MTSERFTREVIITSCGVEVISFKPVKYTESKFDKIIADWREQEIAKQAEARREQIKLKSILKRAGQFIFDQFFYWEEIEIEEEY